MTFVVISIVLALINIKLVARRNAAKVKGGYSFRKGDLNLNVKTIVKLNIVHSFF